MGKNTKIAIIDSGILKQEKFANRVLASYVLDVDSETILLEETDQDYVGHGTAVADIIYETNPSIDFISFRVCAHEMEVDEKGLICILKYIYDCIDVNLVNISAGITYSYHYNELREICKRLYEDKGIIIISAFDNDGGISYPAALEEVIGVDVKLNSWNKEEIYCLENSIVDIVMPNICYRTIWDGKRTIVKGTSFATARVTGLVSKIISDWSFVDKHVITEKISNMKEIIQVDKSIVGPEFKPNRAIIFPINKESKALLRYKGMLDFEIVGVFDERLSGNVGSILFGNEIKAFDSIEWEKDFDTVILSCTNELSKLTKRQYSEEIIDMAKKYNKYVYTFEKIDSDYKNLFYPEISSTMIARKNNFKMSKTTLPIVGVFGTSSRQGKFSLQLEMIKYFKDKGYNVGHIATEPSGYLFGADYVYHFGYHSYLKIQPWESIALLNNMIWETQVKGRDILFTGCQSGTLHYRDSNVEDFAIFQYAFLLGTMPDFVILCVNPHDEVDYVDRTISFINSVGDGKVCALAIFPIRAVQTKSGVMYKVEEVSLNVLQEYRKKFEEMFKIPAYVIGNGKDLEKLCGQIISFF